jgi:hypothetical protein
MLKPLVVAAAVFLSVVATDSPAHAISNCTIVQVQYDSGRLAVLCANDRFYYAFTNQSGCTNQSLDTIKIWASMAQSQYLSGRPVDMATTAVSGSCGVPTITSMNMR